MLPVRGLNYAPRSSSSSTEPTCTISCYVTSSTSKRRVIWSYSGNNKLVVVVNEAIVRCTSRFQGDVYVCCTCMHRASSLCMALPHSQSTWPPVFDHLLQAVKNWRWGRPWKDAGGGALEGGKEKRL